MSDTEGKLSKEDREFTENFFKLNKLVAKIKAHSKKYHVSVEVKKLAVVKQLSQIILDYENLLNFEQSKYLSELDEQEQNRHKAKANNMQKARDKAQFNKTNHKATKEELELKQQIEQLEQETQKQKEQAKELAEKTKTTVQNNLVKIKELKQKQKELAKQS